MVTYLSYYTKETKEFNTHLITQISIFTGTYDKYMEYKYECSQVY